MWVRFQQRGRYPNHIYFRVRIQKVGLKLFSEIYARMGGVISPETTPRRLAGLEVKKASSSRYTFAIYL